MVLNAAARLVVGLGKYEHITPILRDVLHWLPVPQRIQFKFATMTFDCVRAFEAPGLPTSRSIACAVADNSDLPGLRSAVRGDLFVPRTRTTRLGRWSFFIAAPVVWNSLPASPSLPVHQSQSVLSRAQDSSFQTGLSLINSLLFSLLSNCSNKQRFIVVIT